MISSRTSTKSALVQGLYGNTDAVDFEEAWGVLKSSLLEIHSKNASRLSFEELYRHAYKLVLKKKGDILYQKVKDFEEAWLAKTVQPQITSSLSTSLLVATPDGTDAMTTVNEKRVEGEKLLRSLKHAWEDHNLCMNMITDVLMYMERVYCKDFRKPSIFTAAMGQFRDFVLRIPLHADDHHGLTIAQMLNNVILDQVAMERDGDIIDRALLKSCVYILEGLYETEEEEESTKLYLTMFEPEFLTTSRDFYRFEGAALLLDANAGAFCRHAKKRANEEQDRCRSTLSPLTSPKIKAVLEDELIRKHLRDVIALEHSGVRFMLDNDRFQELEMIYDLSARVDTDKKELKKAVQIRVVGLGSEINKAASNPNSGTKPGEPAGEAGNIEEGTRDIDRKAQEKPVNQQTSAAIKWVDDVLQLKMKYDLVLIDAFHSDQILQTAITRSFSEFINQFQRSSEYLSLFFNENMKTGIKGKTENEIDTLIDQGITLLGYVQDKDMFERYYKKHLSKRLLTKRSFSMDAERQMISKMKLAVGNAFTTRIEKMFQDMNTSADLTSNYKQYVASLGDPDPKRAALDVSVLTSTMWPVDVMMARLKEGEPRPTCVFPSEIESIKQGFQKFYLAKHSGRQLTWQAGMGTAEIRGYFPDCKGSKKTRELSVTTYAMVILLLFNSMPANESITCEEIQARTSIPMNDLQRNLQSLSVAPKTRILRKEPMSKLVEPTDKFSFNSSWHSQYQKVKVLLVTSGNHIEGVEERIETEKKNDDERQGVIDAALVRIMKYDPLFPLASILLEGRDANHPTYRQRKRLTHQKLIAEVISQLTARFSPDVSMVKKRIESLIDREYLERIDTEPPAYNYLA
ncbi:uncharacterized protein KY384_002507 [Bacidia gigantensis]|uniref:uncharacterized protein n=1 Tax=Bacidia gigantensis TaxID=2732470 RepID=UPI001D047BD3|nr:uncharacterized protein KY384_002507 [Bacidia gigantensis]KAG8532630.1 hypothetical protein KY384_002507 [Bacidia gigantensis]